MFDFLKRYKILEKNKIFIKYKLNQNESLLYFTDSFYINPLTNIDIPYKGSINTNLSLFWFSHLKYACKTNLITDNILNYPPELKEHIFKLKFNSYIVSNNITPFPFKCHIYGYMTDEQYTFYINHDNIYGCKFDKKIIKSERYQSPLCIFSYQNKDGDDIFINKNCDELKNFKNILESVENLAKQCYILKEYDCLINKDIIPVNMVYRFGLMGNELCLIDAVNVIDDIIYWEKEDYVPGLIHYDYKLEYLIDCDEENISKKVIDKTMRRFFDIYKKETGNDLLIELVK